MKWLSRAFLTVVALVLLLWVWSVARFWIAPRSTANAIAGFDLPPSATFIERGGDTNNTYFSWEIDQSSLNSIAAPSDSEPLFDYPTTWQPFDLGFFGKLQGSDVPADAEALYYRTPFWDVALVRSRSKGILIVAGIYTN